MGLSSSNRLLPILLTTKKRKGFRCPYTFLFFNLYNNKIYTHTNQSGFSLLKFQTTGIEPLINKELKSPVISVLTYDSKNALLVTKSDGLFLFNGKNIVRFETDADEELRKADVNRAIISKIV